MTVDISSESQLVDCRSCDDVTELRTDRSALRTPGNDVMIVDITSLGPDSTFLE